jgi:predicted O-linked N-acetylglucosamine transferase (SPINDLY family)
VAYVSADYHQHPVARHLAGLIESHDATRFETIGIALTHDDKTDIRARMSAAFDTFVEVDKKGDDEVAAMMRDMGVNIAVDLMSFTTNGRPGIFARRAAPIQVNYLGYPGTTGASYIDYMIADKTVIPEDEQRHYSEKIVYLPDTYIPNDRNREIGKAPSRAELGLPENAFVFCSINNSYKFTPEVFDIWMRLMSEVENSVLWLPQSNSAAVRNLDAEAEARGIAANRLVYATYVARSEDHLARLGQADLFLDTLPYNAHSTACEALWAGLPVLTCLGSSFAGRVAASILYACGVPELVTHSLAEYEARARALVLDPSALAEVKAKLARNRLTCPLFDTTRFARNLEAAYTRMWKRYENGDQPEAFAVEAAEAAE